MTSGWSWFIIVLALGNILAMLWLFGIYSIKGKVESSDPSHVWDGDLRELNNPLPRWWLWVFMASVVFGFVYLALYPGLGTYKGLLGWSQAGQHAAEVSAAEAAQAPRFARFAAMSLPELAADPDAMGTARSIYANVCAGCHGSDARGAIGFPDLTDGDWLYGGDPETIVATIANGRMGVMPGWEAALGEAGVNETVAYVRSLSGLPADAALAEAGAARFAMFCVACHGVDGRGNQMLGAPNLTDDVWLYGGDEGALRKSIAAGRSNQMPAHDSLLGRDRVRLLAAYVLSLAEGSGRGPSGGG